MSTIAHPSESASTPSYPHQLFEGTTWHSRLLPSVHKFTYPYRYWGVNISALAAGQCLPEVATPTFSQHKGLKGLPLFSAQHSALQQFYAEDYLKGNYLNNPSLPADSLHADCLNDDAKVRDSVDDDNNDTDIGVDVAHGSKVEQPASSVPLSAQTSAQNLTQRLHQAFNQYAGSVPTGDMIGLVVCRNAGIYFSPVNFYLGFDSEQTPTHLLAEVSNTPWNKRHYYGFLLTGANTEFCHDKDFHVSPFNPIDQRYQWQVSVKNNAIKEPKTTDINDGKGDCLQIRIAINISDVRGEVLKTGVKMTGIPMTADSVRQSLRQNPLMNISSLTRIYWHAFKLYAIKKVPYISYDQKLADSQQQAVDINKYDDKNSHSQKTILDASGVQSQNTKYIDKDNETMPARPTDRTPSSTVGKITARLSQAVNNSAVLQPVNNSVNYLARKAIFRALQHIQFGSITIIEDSDEVTPVVQTFGDPTKNSVSNHSKVRSSSAVGRHPLHITMNIHDSNVYRQLLFGGSIALADSYINGEWDTNDLTGLIRLSARNLAVIDNLENRFASISKTFEKAKHQLRSNDQTGAKSNVLAHYDLGNAMYQRFLDPTMMYSSAVYPTPDMSLAQAQQHKLALICQRLQLKAEDHVIEIGTGWGGFAIYAAQHYGCKVTSTTISDAQYQEARRRVEEAGLSDNITLLKQDYRELTGHYDKLVSIEMIEAVGHEYLPTFFAKCNDLLKPTGLMVLQAITFNDQNYSDYVKSVDFIQTHIFPGGCLLSNQELTTQFAKQTDMVVKQLHDYGFDYAYTLRDWRATFMAQRAEIKALGYDEAFIRLWEFYFCYCEGGFLERTIGVVQVTAVKPDNIDTLHFSDLPAA
ncbi:cyclopropane fatty-acyl-phospholipid synthase-like methyltransferase/DUF1365 family protein [Psychrobacter sp. PL15]|uniref:DUF1365 family protein n=1 Tax=Psychrobacter sp. PL15 TaxID=3071719 RepID=UPI002E03E507|nr:cyclopropane fatty-acyl-phospholipid synthase-like methyltransferase/DUF1365 family protein [Psychrobacter sp. PL15]